MKITFEVNSVDDGEEVAKQMMLARDMAAALSAIRCDIFRPARKHGYSNPAVAKALESCGDAGYELISTLEDMFNEILTDSGLTTLEI